MNRNISGQKWTVYAYDRTTSAPTTGDSANITATLRIDDGTATSPIDTNPTELENGYYNFDLAQAETNGIKLLISAISSTPGVQVNGCPPVIYTKNEISGSNTIIFNIKDDSAVNILGAWVEIWDSVNTGYYERKQTDSAGNASFNMEAGTYKIRLIKSGYSSDTKTCAVSAAATVPYTMSTYIIPSPADTDLCRLYTYLYDPDGSFPLATDVTPIMIISTAPSITSGYSSTESINGVYAVATGLVYFDVVRLATGTISIPGFIGGDVIVPDADTADIKTLIL